MPRLPNLNEEKKSSTKDEIEELRAKIRAIEDQEKPVRKQEVNEVDETEYLREVGILGQSEGLYRRELLDVLGRIAKALEKQ